MQLTLAVEADLLVSYQLDQPRFIYLWPGAFEASHVVETLDDSKRTHSALQKAGIISCPLPAKDGDAEVTVDMIPVNTSKITRHFANQVPFLSGRYVMRRLVSLLFFWEEEVSRWRVLDAEEREIEALLPNAPDFIKDELGMRLEAVQMRKNLLPSQRPETTPNVGHGVQDELPAYE